MDLIYVGKLKQKVRFGELGVDDRIAWRWNLKEHDVWVCNDHLVQDEALCEHCYKAPN